MTKKKGRKVKKSTTSAKKVWRFLGLFVGTAIAEFLALYLYMPQAVNNTIMNGTAEIVKGILGIFGLVILRDGRTLLLPSGMQLEVVYECTGGFAAFIFVACVVAYPARLLPKIYGIVGGIAGIFILNIIRLSFIAWLGIVSPNLFDFFHKYLWQGAFIVVVLIMWGFWVEIFAEGKKK